MTGTATAGGFKQWGCSSTWWLDKAMMSTTWKQSGSMFIQQSLTSLLWRQKWCGARMMSWRNTIVLLRLCLVLLTLSSALSCCLPFTLRSASADLESILHSFTLKKTLILLLRELSSSTTPRCFSTMSSKPLHLLTGEVLLGSMHSCWVVPDPWTTDNIQTPALGLYPLQGRSL